MAELLIIIPAYNEEKNIGIVVERLISKYPQFDYIVINDGSKDNTARVCREKGYNMIDLPINLGLAGAFQTGMKYACERDYLYAVQFDGDGQHRPEFFEPMLRKIREGYDIVIASRFIGKKKPNSMRMLGSNMIQMALKLTTGTTIYDPTSGMRMFSRKIMCEFARGLNYGPEPDTLSYLIKNGARVAEVPVIMDERISGVSYLTPVNAGKYMIRMLTSILFIQNFRQRDGRFAKNQRKGLGV